MAEFNGFPVSGGSATMRARTRQLLAMSQPLSSKGGWWHWLMGIRALGALRCRSHDDALALLLEHLVWVSHARLCVALGAGDGIAAVAVAAALRAVPGSRGDRALIVCEPRLDAARRLRDLLRRAALSRHVDVRVESAARVLARLDQPVDLLLATDPDAHTLQCLPLAVPHLRSGASMVIAAPLGNGRLRPVIAAMAGPLDALQLPVAGGVHWLVKR